MAVILFWGETSTGMLGERRRLRLPSPCCRLADRTFGFIKSLTIDDSAFVTIGDDVTIGPEVRFITINHPTDVIQRLQDVMYARPITIGSACWIGARATILPGATVGYGSTIGAGAVVTGNIPEYSVAVGVPARVVKRVFPTLPASTAPAALDSVCDMRSAPDEKDGVV